MGMLDRYKKTGGFLQLLQLIETSSRQKQDQFLGLVGQESPVWEAELRKRILTLDRILGWEPIFLTEIFSRIQTLTLASAFHGQDQDRLESILSLLNLSEQRKIKMKLQEINPNAAEKMTSQLKILSDTRAMISQGLIKLEKADPELVIPDGIEEKLSQLANTYVAPKVKTSSETEKARVHFGEPTAENKAQSKIGSDRDSISEIKLDSKADLKCDSLLEPQDDLSPVAKSETRIGSKIEANKDEIESLKKKVNQLVNENNMLKHELSVYKNKLDQIRKIA
jgi:hypothetical protein